MKKKTIEMIKNNEEDRKVLSFLDEECFLKRLYPILENEFILSSDISESHVRRFSNDYSVEQLAMIIQMLKQEIKVKEFNRTYLNSSLTSIFALLAVIFSLLIAAINIKSDFHGDEAVWGVFAIPVILLTLILIIIGFDNKRIDKSYRRTNRILLFVKLTKEYKLNGKII